MIVVLKHVTCYSIGVYPRSVTVVLMLAAPHFSISVSRFLVENIRKSFTAEFFLITLRTNVIHFALETSEIKDEST